MSLFLKKSLDFDMVTTKGGDSGKSSLYSGEFLFKNDYRFEVIGNIDELTSYLGICRNNVEKSVSKQIAKVQEVLYSSMSIIATTFENELYKKIPQVKEDDIIQLEHWQRTYLEKTNIEPRFVIPGEINKVSAHFDFARTIARRCERKIVEYLNDKGANALPNVQDLFIIQKYLNRLSDYLFVTARYLEKF